jgi:hypothetical protein
MIVFYLCRSGHLARGSVGRRDANFPDHTMEVCGIILGTPHEVLAWVS